MSLKKISKLAQAMPRNPHLDSVRDDLNRLKLLWVVSSTSPLLYLAVSHYVKLTFFNPPTEVGLAPLSPQHFTWAVLACAVFAAGMQMVQLYLRRRYAGAMGQGKHVTSLLRLYRNRTLALMAASEVPVLLGFGLFLMQGDLRVLFLFGLVSLVLYGQSYPSETTLGSYAKSRR